ncbi:MAG: glycosyltransferase [Armatimonadetes bacterium]|nr:glycosyltransferase [Armatimonadota bacterium]
MKIAVFSDSFVPILNGVSISIKSLVDELRRKGHSVHIFTAGAPGHKDSDPNIHRFFSYRTPWSKDYPITLPPFYPIIPAFRREKFDIIHTHTPFMVGFVGLRWGESHHVPVVSTYHTLYDKYVHYFPFFPKRYTRYRIAKHTNFYYNSVAHVITPSEASRKWLLRHSVKTPITVIPTAQFAPGERDKAQLRLSKKFDPASKILLYVGRIAVEKNMLTLIDAVAVVMKKDPAVFFLVVGDGPFREQCKQHVNSLGIGDRVRFEGFVPRDQVDDYYALSDIFVFASVTETQGLVVSEAMSYGLPAVVVTGGGAGASVIPDENGFLVGNDPAKIAEGVLTLLFDKDLLSKMSGRASLSVRGYTVSDMTDRILGVYDSVLSSSSTLRNTA